MLSVLNRDGFALGGTEAPAAGPRETRPPETALEHSFVVEHLCFAVMYKLRAQFSCKLQFHICDGSSHPFPKVGLLKCIKRHLMPTSSFGLQDFRRRESTNPTFELSSDLVLQIVCIDAFVERTRELVADDQLLTAVPMKLSFHS